MRETEGTTAPNCDDKDWVRVAPSVGTPLNLSDFNRTPFGCVPETLLHRLGVFNEVAKEVLAYAEPHCAKCNVTVPRVRFERALEILAENAAQFSGNVEGSYVAAVPGASEIPLLEHMELLESDRAVVEGRLVRREDVKGELGSPVLAVGARPDALKDTLQKWRTSGGSVITVFYFPTRTSEGVELHSFSDELRCSRCGELHRELTHQLIDSLPPCPRCKGVGWFPAKDRYDLDVLHACLDCSGFGAISSLFEYRFNALRLRDFLTLSFKDLHKAFVANDVRDGAQGGSAWRVVLEEVSRSPFGEYRSGTPISLLSYDERVVLTALQCLTAGYRGRTLLFDLGTLSAPSQEVRDFLQNTVARRITAKVIGTSASSQVPYSAHSHNAPLLRISDVIEKGIKVDHLSFPKGENTFIWGGIEGAHVKLLEIVSNRFIKRKKFSQTSYFDGCSELLMLSSRSVPSVLIADLIGVEEKLAELYASTASAKKLGLGKASFKVIRALLDYSAHSVEREDRGQSCGGDLYDWRLSTVSVGSFSFHDLVHLPLHVLPDSIILDDATDFMLREVAKWIPETTTLGAPVSSLSPALAHHIYLLSRLLGAHGALIFEKQKKRMPLILVDTPYSGVPNFDAEIQKTMALLCKQGATIISAGGELRNTEDCAKVVAFRHLKQPTLLNPYFHERYTLTWEPFEYRSVSG